MKTTRRLIAGVALLAAAHVAVADQATDAQEVVDASTRTYNEFMADSGMDWLKNNIGKAKGLLIVPTYGKAGFIIGGAGGSGLLVGRDGSTGKWSNPAFYTMVEASIGLQIGAQGSAIIFAIMTDKAFNQFVNGKTKLGADVNVAVGPVGGGASAEIADVYAFAKSKGAYGGLSVEGGIVQVYGERNAAYYGKPVMPADVVVKHMVTNPGAAPLVKALSGM